MKIIIAKNAGYCFGVRDAVDMAHDIAKQEGEVYMLGDIVHNERVVNDLNNAGAKVVNSFKKGYEFSIKNPQESITSLISIAGEEIVEEDVERAGVELLIDLNAS